ncbi:hypothetical protein ACJJIF_09805 [Microbulbifer sp. SSSA002]|uniref:hypothetical protein n=1 Tax=Microbulbifer sp. SSSA002 TaxID=3243376 RepID=UPI00403A1D93
MAYQSLSTMHHFHGIISFLWILLICSQAYLALGQSTSLHKYLGWLSLIVATLFIGTSSWVFSTTLESTLEKDKIFQLVYWVDLFLLPLFVFFLLSGFLQRKSPKKHMLCMMLSLIVILPPGLGRLIYGLFLFPFDAPIRYFYEPMMLTTLGILVYLGFRERWQFSQVKVALGVTAGSFASSYWAVNTGVFASGVRWALGS